MFWEIAYLSCLASSNAKAYDGLAALAVWTLATEPVLLPRHKTDRSQIVTHDRLHDAIVSPKISVPRVKFIKTCQAAFNKTTILLLLVRLGLIFDHVEYFLFLIITLF